MKRTHTRKFWIGFTDDAPDVGQYSDSYGTHRGMQLFTERKEAKRRYQDVRYCEVQVKERK